MAVNVRGGKSPNWIIGEGEVEHEDTEKLRLGKKIPSRWDGVVSGVQGGLA